MPKRIQRKRTKGWRKPHAGKVDALLLAAWGLGRRQFHETTASSYSAAHQARRRGS